MDDTTVVRDSQVMLEQMAEEPEAVLEALGPTEGRAVLVRLRELSGQAAGVNTGAELLELADAVHRLVEQTPALADLLLEQGAGATNQRTFPALDPNDPAHGESPQAAEKAVLMRNHMANLAERLDGGLGDEAEESR